MAIRVAIALTNVQIAAIVVAAALVVALIIIMAVSRSRRSDEAESKAEDQSGAFLEGAPHDSFAGLGKPEAPGAAAEPAAPSWVSVAAPSDAPTTDETPAATAPEATDASPETEKPVTIEVSPSTEATDEAPAAADEAPAEPSATEPSPEVAEAAAALVEPVAEAQPAEHSDEAPPAEVEPAGAEVAPAEGGKHLMPLSEIIVTTSHKMVDLDDPDVRSMLKDLVAYEIDQASQYRQLGQNLDAVLQLTEAEKICHALSMDDQAGQIREMIRDLQT
jgi:hypothetical protein